jgi:hypothetical protein
MQICVSDFILDFVNALDQMSDVGLANISVKLKNAAANGKSSRFRVQRGVSSIHRRVYYFPNQKGFRKSRRVSAFHIILHRCLAMLIRASKLDPRNKGS